jgi:mannan endo-1,6-alpha-mannosidase
VWAGRLNKLVEHGLSTFFYDQVAVEPSCEDHNTCTTDMLSFKGYIHRWYSTVTRLAPFTADTILPVLRNSAQAAVKQCTGGDLGRQCGFKWLSGKFDGNVGAGQEMNVLGAVSSLLIDNVGGPVGTDTGGTRKGDPNAGAGTQDVNKTPTGPVTGGDRAGAAILTIVMLGSACGLFGWMSFGER